MKKLRHYCPMYKTDTHTHTHRGLMLVASSNVRGYFPDASRGKYLVNLIISSSTDWLKSYYIGYALPVPTVYKTDALRECMILVNVCRKLVLYAVDGVPPSHWYYSKSSWHCGKHHPWNPCKCCLFVILRDTESYIDCWLLMFKVYMNWVEEVPPINCT